MQTVAYEDSVTWLLQFVSSGQTFIQQFNELGEAIASLPEDGAPSESFISKAQALREIASWPFNADLPVHWRQAQGLTRAIAKSFQAILVATANLLEAPLSADLPPLQEELQSHHDRAGTLLGNFGYALAGLQVRANAPFQEILASLATPSSGQIDTATEFTRHYFSIEATHDIRADVAMALAMSAFTLESRDHPEILQPIVRRLWKRLSRSRSWALPRGLVDELRLAGDRIQSSGEILDAVRGIYSGVVLDEEKARIAGRLAEEGLRPLLAILTYLVEGRDDPARYEPLRVAMLADLLTSLGPRLRADERFLVSFPIDYRHAYAHGSISNDGAVVIFELIQPPRRVQVTSVEIEKTLQELFDTFSVLMPVLLLTVESVMSPGPAQSLMPVRMLGTQAELLMAQFGIPSAATATGTTIEVNSQSLPVKPTTLLNVAGGLATTSRERVLSIRVPEGPLIDIPLQDLPPAATPLMPLVLARYRLLTEWTNPPLSELATNPERIDGELVHVMADVLYGVWKHLVESDDHRRKGLEDWRHELNASISILESLPEKTSDGRRLLRLCRESSRDCDRALNSTTGAAPPIPGDPGYADLVRAIASRGLRPTEFAGSIS